MNSGGTPLLSVRAEARQLVAPDYAELDGQLEHTAGSKAEAVRSVTGSLDQLTADLAALGAVPFDAGADRRPLTWSAYSWGTHEELYHDAAMLLQVPLVVFLGPVERGRRGELGDDLPLARLLLGAG